MFFHEGFTLTKHDRSRLASTLHDLQKKGKVTTAQKREKHWLGSFLTRKLAYGLFIDALKNGTSSWTSIIARVLNIIMTAAAGARTGDLTQAAEDTNEMPFLSYGDITLKLSGGDGLSNLVAQVVIRNEKGHK